MLKCTHTLRLCFEDDYDDDDDYDNDCDDDYDDSGGDDDCDFNQHWQFCGFQLHPLAL